ncbi:MAG: histidine kinase N-terminal 7TM domain-containing protein [Porcipelethomonas sp.]
MYEILLAVQYASILLLLVECGYIFIKWETKIHSYLFFNCVATLVNNAGYLMLMLSKTENEYLMALQLSYMGRVWISYSLFIFVMKICKIEIKRWILVGLAAFHVATYGMVLTSQWQPLYYSSIEYVETGIFPHLECGHGIWHTLFSIVQLFYIVFGLSQLIRVTIKEKDPFARKRLMCVLTAIIVQSVFYIAQVIEITPSYDITFLGYTIGTVINYIALFKYDLLDILSIVKDYVTDNLSEAIIAVNNDYRLEYTNKPAKKIFPDIENSSSEAIERIQYSIDNGIPLEQNGRIYSPDAADLVKDNTVKGKIFALVDNTEHYLYLKELEEQKKIAEEANASKSQFISVVSHEIRTPMNAVVGMTELLLRENENLTKKQCRYLNNIKNSGSALVSIVNDILDQSKIESGKMDIIEGKYELRPLISDIKLIIENRIEKKPIEIICEIDDSIPDFLVGDSLRIRQILINLMNNSVKFTKSGYIKLVIKCVQTINNRKLLKFSVIDSGQGMKPEDLTKIGQAFTQVDQQKNHHIEGTGLGLSISKDFISLMGGKLDVKSEYGKGTEFFFTISQGLPPKEDISEAAGNADGIHNPEEFTAPGARILIVDDTELNLVITEELLASLMSKVDTADSGNKAIEMVKNNEYNIIFMDYIMPYMDGAETTAKIRELGSSAEAGEGESADYYSTVPIITLSGDTSEETKDKFIKAGSNDFIEKPIQLKSLRAMLLKWLPDNLIDSSNYN